jgi:predicted DNA-binding protein with PD1-like motif
MSVKILYASLRRIKMKSKKMGRSLYVRLEAGEEIIGKLTEVILEYGIRLGKISGIGACERAVIGNFDPQSREYRKETLLGTYEILSLAGNITEMNAEPYLHIHICLGDEKMQVCGGHLNEAIISATAEIVIEICEGNLARYKDIDSGLNLWDI